MLTLNFILADGVTIQLGAIILVAVSHLLTYRAWHPRRR